MDDLLIAELESQTEAERDYMLRSGVDDTLQPRCGMPRYGTKQDEPFPDEKIRYTAFLGDQLYM